MPAPAPCPCNCNHCPSRTTNHSSSQSQPPPYSPNHKIPTNQAQTPNPTVEPILSKDVLHTISDLCPKCLEQVTGKEFFYDVPKHNHASPKLQSRYTIYRPEPRADKDKAVGWWTRWRVRRRERELITRAADLERADTLEKSSKSLERWTARSIRDIEEINQRYDARYHSCI